MDRRAGPVVGSCLGESGGSLREELRAAGNTLLADLVVLPCAWWLEWGGREGVDTRIKLSYDSPPQEGRGRARRCLASTGAATCRRFFEN